MPFQPSYEVPESRHAYTFLSGRTGCLMLHGFLGSPASSRPLAQSLAEQGVTVHCPLLPGHGELPNKLYGVRREDWIAEAVESLAFLRPHCDRIFIMGHSMGTVLGAYLVSQNDDVGGMIMLAPAYQVPSKSIHLLRGLRYVMPWLYPMRFKRLHKLVRERLLDFDPALDIGDPALQAQLPEMTKVPTGAIDEMRKTLDLGRRLWPHVDTPAIIFQGEQDIAVDVDSTRKLFAQLLNADKRLVLFPTAGHELMRPFEPVHVEVWRQVQAFILSHSPVSALEPLAAATKVSEEALE